MLKKVAGYIRVSTNKQEQITSLETQVAIIKNFCTTNGYQLTEIFKDVCSGIGENRPGFQKLLSSIENEEFDILLVKDVSRLTRHTTTATKIKDLLVSHDINLVTIDGSINMIDTPSSIYTLVGIAQYCENESRTISSRICTSRLSAAQMGKFTGSIAPYGYSLKNKSLYVSDDETPNVVKRIFREFIEGKSMGQIAKDLESDNIHNPSRQRKKTNLSVGWGYSTIRGILQNQAYCGNLMQQKTYKRDVTSSTRFFRSNDNIVAKKNTHPPIISEEDFTIVQDMLNAKKESPPRNSNHLYSNILFCADCGSKMHIRKNLKGESYYICGSVNKNKKNINCTKHKIFKTVLTNHICMDIKTYMQSINLSLDSNGVESFLESHFLDIEKKLKEYPLQVEAYNDKKLSAYLDKHSGLISGNDYLCFTKAFDKDIIALEEKISHCILQINNKEQIYSDLYGSLSDINESILSVEKLTPDLLHRLVKKIEITDDGKIIIHYRFKDKYA